MIVDAYIKMIVYKIVTQKALKSIVCEWNVLKKTLIMRFSFRFLIYIEKKICCKWNV